MSFIHPGAHKEHVIRSEGEGLSLHGSSCLQKPRGLEHITMCS